MVFNVDAIHYLCYAFCVRRPQLKSRRVACVLSKAQPHFKLGGQQSMPKPHSVVATPRHPRTSRSASTGPFLEPGCHGQDGYRPTASLCTVHHMEAKLGGTFRMSFTNFGTGNGHSFGGEYLELVPGSQDLSTPTNLTTPTCPAPSPDHHHPQTRDVRHRGEHVLQEDLPEVIPVEMCYLGWQESLAATGHAGRAQHSRLSGHAIRYNRRTPYES
jgi:hypothetical protein